MSIIRDALSKAAIKRKGVVSLQDEGPAAKTKKTAPKKIGRIILSGIGILFIAALAVVAFFYSTEFVPSFDEMSIKKSPPVTFTPKDIDRDIVARKKIARRSKAPEEEIPQLTGLALTGVIEGGGESLAVINGRILRKGDFIQGTQVIGITSDSATLLYDDKEITLRIK